MTGLLHHLSSLDGAPTVGWLLIAAVVLTAVCAVWADRSEGSNYQQGERL